MLKEILGNKRNIEHLSKAEELGKLSHAYMICGEKGSGKRVFTDYITQGLMCEKNGIGQGPCGVCPTCAKTLSGNHPDIVRIKPPAPGKQIPVAAIRQQLTDDIIIKPFYEGYKIYIVEDAQLLNENSQNALLKTIEEPPEYGIIFLLTENPDALLETIRSRCIRLDMEQLDSELIQQVLIKEFQAGNEEANMCSAFARGNLGKAIDLFENEEQRELLINVIKTMKNISRMSALEISRQASEYERSGESSFVLLSMRMWLRDVLCMKSGCAAGNGYLYFPGEASAARQEAGKITYESINAGLAAIDECEQRIRANVKTDAALESMMLKMRENSK